MGGGRGGGGGEGGGGGRRRGGEGRGGAGGGGVLPNEYRPFDCESWPFYIMKKSDKFIITKSNDCPIFAKIDNKILTDFIKRKFFIIAEKVVRENPGMITEYNRDLDILYEFSINE